MPDDKTKDDSTRTDETTPGVGGHGLSNQQGSGERRTGDQGNDTKSEAWPYERWRMSRGVKPPQCKLCPRFARGQGFTPGDISPQAQIVGVGKFAGKSEAITGRPYSGGGGQLLDGILQRAGLIRGRDIGLTNLCKCFAEGEPTTAEYTYCVNTYLHTELKNRRVIVAMGALPAQLLAGVESIKRERGRVVSLVDSTVVATLEPAGLIWSRSEAKNTGEKRDYLPVVIKDFVKAKRLAQSDTQQAQVIEQFYASPTPEQVTNYIQRCADNREYALDIETSYWKDGGHRITLTGLSCGKRSAICIPNWPQYHEPLQRLFDDKRCLYIDFNDQFDPHIQELPENGWKAPTHRFDAMLADHCVESDMGEFDLESVCGRQLDYPLWVHLKKTNLPLANCYDVAATYELKQVLLPEMQELGCDWVFWNHQMPMANICYEIGNKGIRVDEEAMMKAAIAVGRIRDRLEAGLTAAVGPLFNYKSPQQLKELLYDVLKMPVQYHRRQKNPDGSRKPTTDHYALEMLFEKTGSKLVETILELRKYDKLSSSFMSGEYIHPDGRVHPDVLQHRAVTGRLSFQKPNMQQQPKGPVRAMYLPDEPGWFWIAADYSQIEMRVLAVLSRCTNMLHRLAENDNGLCPYDVHTLNAQKFYGTIDVTKTQRSLAKNMFYGMMYGQGKGSLAIMYNVTEQYAESYIRFIDSEYPECKRYRQGLLNTIEDRNYLKTPYGRVRWLWNRSAATEAFIFPPQSTAFDILADATIELHKRLPKPARIGLLVHDDIAVFSPPELVDECCALVGECMSRAKPRLDNYVFPVKIGKGVNYDAATHEEGLVGDWRRLRRTIK